MSPAGCLHDDDCDCKPTVPADVRLKQAEALLRRAVKYATEDKAETPGVTRLARWLGEATTFLAAAPPAGVPDPVRLRDDGAGCVPCAVGHHATCMGEKRDYTCCCAWLL